jgi:hypothetical protein
MAFAALLRKVRNLRVSDVKGAILMFLTASTPDRGFDGRLRRRSYAKRIRRGEDRGREAIGRRQ